MVPLVGSSTVAGVGAGRALLEVEDGCKWGDESRNVGEGLVLILSATTANKSVLSLCGRGAAISDCGTHGTDIAAPFCDMIKLKLEINSATDPLFNY